LKALLMRVIYETPSCVLNMTCRIIVPVLVLLCWHSTISAESFKLVTGEFAPFTGQDLPDGGLTSEIIKRAFETMEHTTRIEFRPWKRGYQSTLKHEYFGTFPYVKTKERSEQFFYSNPIYTARVLWFARDDLDIPYTKDEDVKGLRACNPLGYSTKSIQKFIDQKLVHLITPKGDKECFKLIKMGRAHLYAVNEVTGWQVIQELYGTKAGFRTLGKSLQENTYHLMVARNYPYATKWLEQFNEGLANLQKQDVLKSIIIRHLGH